MIFLLVLTEILFFCQIAYGIDASFAEDGGEGGYAVLIVLNKMLLGFVIGRDNPLSIPL